LEENNMDKGKSDYKKTRENKFKIASRDRLSKILKKKIQTTMIGALSSIEENLGFLWNSEGGQLTKDQEAMKDLYNKIRSEILDKGNNQARNIDAELAQYDVEWLKYSVTIPMVKNKED
tara:strand:- start:1625 stop:1981 length:357 start_codon:yes stop_codon:yes gene_type:complete